jgi:hypothetical protein
MKSIDPNLARRDCRGPVLSDDRSKDLDRKQCVLLAVRSAFPLPDTGTFTDLLSAIDMAGRRR